MLHQVTEAEDGMLLRTLLRSVMQVSYTALKSARWNGRITVDGNPRRVDQPVRCGEVVELTLRRETPAYPIQPWDYPLRLLYRDDFLLVAEKPGGVPSTSGQHQGVMTMENALFSALGCPEGWIYRPVNRLDKGTGGLMTVALDGHTQQLLQAMLHTEDFRREYLAVTEGTPPMEAGVIDLPIALAGPTGVKRRVDPAGKPSVTHYQVLQKSRERCLVRLRLETGRTHQIRVHLAHLGCPIYGDYLYGRERPDWPGRFALHSAEITLRHPITGELLHFASPLPEDMAGLVFSDC